MAQRTEQFVTIEGRKLRLTSLEKVLYAKTGTTKADIIEYYRQIAPVMLPHCVDRPVTRKRWPHGVDETGQGDMFFQKDLGEGAPGWVETADIQHSDHVNTYPLANNLATLVWLTQLSALELHVPQWKFGRDKKPQNPDRMVFDLDPGEGVGLPECVDVAKLVRDILRDMGLESIPVTSGSKGIHLYVALDGSAPSDDISDVAKELARSLEADHPSDIISTMKKVDRKGKVFIDWSQNNASKTTIAPYSLRGRARPMVAAPRTWRELFSPHLKQLDMHEVLQRVERRGDPLAENFDTGRARELADSEGSSRPDRLDRYRTKRDPARTSEPIPEGRPALGTSQPVFVIQRHEARRLHYDFRLEHGGVLASWALPKGVPTHEGRNHLAVQTEDHPMEYRFFEGEIPKGEYGGGTVEIWDAGTVDIEKWRDDHITVTLTGQPDGGLGGSPKRFTLIHTRPGENSWLIHLTKRQPAREMRQEIPAPMLATLASEAEVLALDPHDWRFEGKWDGYRAIAQVRDARVTLTSRNGNDLTDDYPELQHIAEAALDSVTLDGEIVAITEHGLTDFSLLQRGDVPASYLVFDVLEVNGIETRRLPYRHRRELLEDLAPESDSEEDTSWRIPPPIDAATPAEAIAVARELGLEGIMAKRAWSTYRQGRRSSDWLKLPFQTGAEVVIIGWRTSESDARGFASLLLAAPSADTSALSYVGRVGTGFTQAERHRLRTMLAPLKVSRAPLKVPRADQRDATWVTPKLVGEVIYKGMTPTGKLRHASWRGLRPDKDPDALSPLAG